MVTYSPATARGLKILVSGSDRLARSVSAKCLNRFFGDTFLWPHQIGFVSTTWLHSIYVVFPIRTSFGQIRKKQKVLRGYTWNTILGIKCSFRLCNLAACVGPPELIGKSKGQRSW